MQWLIVDEAEVEANTFETQLKFMVLANNPILYKHFWPEQEEADEGIVWQTPETQEEIEDLMALLDMPMEGGENPESLRLNSNTTGEKDPS